MMMSEFIERTGIEPTAEEYGMIEEMYYEYEGDKNAFCKDFVKKNRMVEALRRLIAEKRDTIVNLTEGCCRANTKAAEMEAKVKDLETKLEREQEWKPYEDEHNVRQADYERLDADSSRRELTDDEAADMIAQEFGFDRSKIRIVHEVAKLEISRHRRTRKVGAYERKALFDAWDWNYICFNVKGNTTMGYEMHNGQLQMYWG